MPRDSSNDISPDQLLKAYTLGYFPMGRRRDDPKTVWVLPDIRGVLPLENATSSRKLRKFIRSEPFSIRINTAFGEVIRACAAPGPGREDTWINDPIEEVYCELHRLGYAHCVECYAGERLVGGVYGVAMGAVFCGESMFSKVDNASKVALAYLIHRLKSSGFRLLDTQFHTDHLAQFGVQEMPDATYQKLLATYLRQKADFLKAPAYSSTGSVLQSITQTS